MKRTGHKLALPLSLIALLVFGAVPLFVQAQTALTGADAQCSAPYVAQCGCNQVMNKQTNKCEKGSNSYQCPCSETTNGALTSGMCAAQSKCLATKTNGQTPQLPTPQQEQGSQPGSQPSSSESSPDNSSGGSSGSSGSSGSAGSAGSASPSGTEPSSAGASPSLDSSQPLGTVPSPESPEVIPPGGESNALDTGSNNSSNALESGTQNSAEPAQGPSVLQSALDYFTGADQNGSALSPDSVQAAEGAQGSSPVGPDILQSGETSLQSGGDFPQENTGSTLGEPSDSGPANAESPASEPTSLESTLSSPMGNLPGLDDVGNENSLANSSPSDVAAQDLQAIQNTIQNDASQFGSWVDSIGAPSSASTPDAIGTPTQQDSAAALNDAAQAFGADRGYTPNQINTVAAGLAGVAQQESQLNPNFPSPGQYQGLGQLNNTETNSAINTLTQLSESPNLTPDQQDQVQGELQAIQEMQANGVNPNNDPETGAWLLAARQADVPEMNASPMDTAAEYATSPQSAAAIMEGAQLAPAMFVNQDFDPSDTLSGKEITALSSNAVSVGSGSTVGDAIAAMQSSSIYSPNFDTGVAIEQGVAAQNADPWSGTAVASVSPLGDVSNYPAFAEADASLLSAYNTAQSTGDFAGSSGEEVASAEPSAETPATVSTPNDNEPPPGEEVADETQPTGEPVETQENADAQQQQLADREAQADVETAAFQNAIAATEGLPETGEAIANETAPSGPDETQTPTEVASAEPSQAQIEQAYADALANSEPLTEIDSGKGDFGASEPLSQGEGGIGSDFASSQPTAPLSSGEGGIGSDFASSQPSAPLSEGPGGIGSDLASSQPTAPLSSGAGGIGSDFASSQPTAPLSEGQGGIGSDFASSQPTEPLSSGSGGIGSDFASSQSAPPTSSGDEGEPPPGEEIANETEPTGEPVETQENADAQQQQLADREVQAVTETNAYQQTLATQQGLPETGAAIANETPAYYTPNQLVADAFAQLPPAGDNLTGETAPVGAVTSGPLDSIVDTNPASFPFEDPYSYPSQFSGGTIPSQEAADDLNVFAGSTAGAPSFENSQELPSWMNSAVTSMEGMQSAVYNDWQALTDEFAPAASPGETIANETTPTGEPVSTQNPSSPENPSTPNENPGAQPSSGETPPLPTARPSLPSNPSIVDFLNSMGQDASFASRAALAAYYGIANYVGSAAQNLQLLRTCFAQGCNP